MHPLKDAIRRDMNDLAATVAGGSCKSWEEYQHITGVIEGLARAERIVLDWLEKAHLED